MSTGTSRPATVLDDPGWVGAIFNLALVWGALAASILLLSRLGSNFGAEDPSGPRVAPWTPSGAIIGGVWSCLYTLMALALWVLNRTPEPFRPSLKSLVAGLIGFCLVWPFYAFTPASRWPGLLGNLGILLISLFVLWRLWPYSRPGALMIAPVAGWITVAAAAILDGARRYGW